MSVILQICYYVNFFLMFYCQDKDDPDKWAELKRMEVEYEKRRIAMVTYAESVRHAQQVQVDDIPLPTLQLPNDPNAFMGLPSQIPLPTDLPVPLSSIISHPMIALPVPPGLALPPPHGILKKTSAYTAIPSKPKKPPGVPPGPPPELSDDDEEEVEEPMDQDGKEYYMVKLGVYESSRILQAHRGTVTEHQLYFTSYMSPHSMSFIVRLEIQV